METENITFYNCGVCRHKYNYKQEALDCEKKHKKEQELDNKTEFEITDNHLKLLQRMNVSWDDCEFGAPCIDPKRPYGNSNGVDDVAEVLGIKKTKDNVDDYDKEEAGQYSDKNEYIEDLDWNEKTYEYLNDIHKEMQIVLQIVLSTLSFKKGIYKKKDKYGNEWYRIDERGEQ